GRYELCIDFKFDVDDHHPFLVIEVVSEDEWRALASVRGALPHPQQRRLEFEVHENESPTGGLPVEVRLRSSGFGGLVKAVKVRRIGAPMQPSPWIKVPDDETNWLEFMAQPTTTRTEDRGELSSIEGLAFGPKDSGLIAHGPGWTLPPGRYEVFV